MCCLVVPFEKLTCKASDAAENLQLYRVVRFFRPRSSCRTHLMLFSERPPIYASSMTISGGKAEQHVVIAGFLPHHWRSSSHIITTNKPTPNFLQAGCPSCRQTNSVKALKEKISYSMDLLTPSSPGGLPTLSLTTNSSCYLGGGLPCLSSAL